jgi:adenosylhomocysteine nucleosidase
MIGIRSPETSVTAVVAALPEELAPLRALLTGIERARIGPLVVESGRLAGRRVALSTTGDGAENARLGVAALLAASRADALIVIGVAGALSAELRTAALVVASRVTDEAGRSFAADDDQVAAVARATGGRAALVVSAARIADSASEKQRLARAAGAGEEAAVVDLESATYVAAAAGAGIPWLVLRAVSDTAEEALPELLNRSRDDGGAVRRGQVFLRLLRQPQALPFLLTLRTRVGACAEVLARAVSAALPTFDGPQAPARVRQAAPGAAP